MAGAGVAGDRLAFDDDICAEEVDRFDAGSRAHTAATIARRKIERPGGQVVVRACDAEGSDGTRLSGCAKVYVALDVEPSGAPFGFVFALRTDPDGTVRLRMLAFGERHPAPGSRSVYERAHKRLHGRYPDE